MKKLVISGSIKLLDKINNWVKYFQENGFEVIDYPVPIDEETFIQDYPDIYRNFYKKITEADFLFILNEDRNGIKGYIGAETFAELTFGVVQNQINNQGLHVILYKRPSTKVQSFDEISLWLKLGWISLYEKSPLNVSNQGVV